MTAYADTPPFRAPAAVVHLQLSSYSSLWLLTTCDGWESRIRMNLKLKQKIKEKKGRQWSYGLSPRWFKEKIGLYLQTCWKPHALLVCKSIASSKKLWFLLLSITRCCTVASSFFNSWTCFCDPTLDKPTLWNHQKSNRRASARWSPSLKLRYNPWKLVVGFDLGRSIFRRYVGFREDISSYLLRRHLFWWRRRPLRHHLHPKVAKMIDKALAHSSWCEHKIPRDTTTGQDTPNVNTITIIISLHYHYFLLLNTIC